MNTTKTLLIIGSVWPEPQSSAAGTRMMQLISLFPATEWNIVFASAASASPNMADLVPLGVRSVDIMLNSGTFDLFVAELSPHTVLFDRFMVEEQFGWRVAAQCPGAVRILDTEDLHCLRHARYHAIKVGRDFAIDDVRSEPMALREIASILRCDLTIMISEIEIEILLSQFNIDAEMLVYIPLFAQRKQTLPNFAERKDFVFIGNFYHEPNVDAVNYLKTVIWPLIHPRTDAHLNIYGAYTPTKISSLENTRQRFFVHGRAADASEVIANARVMLAPLRFGAGLKGKLINAMELGTPSITSSVGAEGIAAGRPWNGMITDDPNKFADASVAAYRQIDLWNEYQTNGFEIIQSRFQKSAFASVLLDRMQDLSDNLSSHRNRNFTGRMLLHHMLRSNEYMSRWIEAKNKA